MTWNVTVKYNLSEAGRKAAILTGKPATAEVTETMSFDDPTLIDRVTVKGDGSMAFDSTYVTDLGHDFYLKVVLDQPPADLVALLAAYDIFRSGLVVKKEQRDAERTVRLAQEAAELAARQAINRPVIDALLDELEALDPLAAVPDGIGLSYYDLHKAGFPGLTNDRTDEQKMRSKAVYEKRQAAQKQAEEEAARKATEKREALIAQHGGCYWPGGQWCDFDGYKLWSSSTQTKRWVGEFSGARGIDVFLDSPRGEYTFDISSLRTGDMIQLGGYDTSSRGKRRNESEAFGVVLRNDAGGFVVKFYDSRAAALKATQGV